jgi:hypothetical protein
VNGRLNKTVEKLRDKAYRDAYVESHVKIGIPHQIRALREQEDRKWSQAELGRRTHKPANVICRLEDPEYGRHTIRTLLEIGAAFDVALLVKYVSYSRFLREFEDVSPPALEVPSFTSDPGLVGSFHPGSNISNALIGILEPGQALNVAEVELQPGIDVYWTNYQSKEKRLVGRICYAGEGYQFQKRLAPQDYSEKTSLGGSLWGNNAFWNNALLEATEKDYEWNPLFSREAPADAPAMKQETTI